MMNKSIVIDGSGLAYTLTGTGETVMLLHGFGEDRQIWNQIESYLNKCYRLLIPDLPGSGQSESLKKTEPQLTDFASALYQLIVKEGIKKITIIGHSMGGYIALAFAEMYPGSIHSLGLFHSSAFADDNEKINTRKKGIEFIRANGPTAFLKTSIPALFFDQAISKAEISLLIERAKDFSADSLVDYYNAMITRPDRTKILATFKRPVLIIAGKHDKAVPLEALLQQTLIPSSAYLHILKKSAHMGMLEETEESGAILGVFLENSYSMF
jgi:pimeloyl-ACP methyl ester carboxylesterase